ncbi:AlpA family transcriptional regulator [Aliarcobacter butzleri L349]|nr:AlpA family transcriptional regulator [Aliarcobacter butzleri L349]
MSQKLLRPKEVALYLGIGLSTVWLYAKQGKIKPIKISGKVTVFSIDEINRKFELEDIINNPKQENSY